MLTSRMQKVILLILQAKEYITIQQIADEVLVSTRTVLRELDDVQDWIEKNGGTLDKRKGKGLFFIGRDAMRSQLIERLYSEKSDTIYTPLDRQMILKAQLLKYTEPTKLFSLTKLLDVTESTIGSDLAQLDEWFDKYKLSIVRRPGMGIVLEGKEKAKRRAIVALVYEHFQFIDLIEFISEHKSKALNMTTFKQKINTSIFDLLDIDSLESIKELLYHLEEDLGYQFADNGYFALVIRFSITLKRRGFWGTIELTEKQKSEITKDRIYNYLVDWMKDNPNNPFRELPSEELLYLTIHIKGTKLRETDEYNKISMIEDFKIIQLVKEFIELLERETGIYLTDNEKLLVGLIKHLRPAIYRMKMDLDIYNPLLEEIKNMYPKLFQSVRLCVELIERKENVSIPDDEIAYLAIHIGAIIQKEQREIVKKYQVVVACMYGIGASQLLVTQIEKNFPNVHILRVLSVIDASIEALSSDEVDLLITTVPIKNANIPSVVINQMIKEDDIRRIDEALKAYKPTNRIKKRGKNQFFKEKLMALNIYSDVMLEILDNLAFRHDVSIRDLDELIPHVSSYLAQNDMESDLLCKAFKEREEKGSTILSKKGMMLLHCRADIKKGICVEITYLKNPIYIEQATNIVRVSVIIVMVAPLVLNQKVLEVLSEINHTIITGNLSDIIIAGQDFDTTMELNETLEKFYQSKVFDTDNS